jgi:hypothetical protein
MSRREDTGYLSSVAPNERLDFDGEDLTDYALDGGDDTDLLADVLLHYGQVVEEEELL